MRSLRLWDLYTREEVHKIFSPDTPFTPQAGTWGLQGIVRVPETTADFVFFVTFGSSTGQHEFTEEITGDGALTWQSQPKQKLTDPMIEQFINHDDLSSTLHLFLRTQKRDRYTYFGPLGYLGHDPEREQPVHFEWQLLQWPPSTRAIATAGVTLSPASESGDSLSPKAGLHKTDPPTPAKSGVAGASGLKNQAHLPGNESENALLGLAGEELVMAAERARLVAAGRAGLAAKVVHVAVVEGDAAGYDIRSFENDGAVRHIEVKTTRGPKSRAFFISPNEIRFSQEHPDSYVLTRLFRYADHPSRAAYYELRGSIIDHFDLTPTAYRAQIKAVAPDCK